MKIYACWDHTPSAPEHQAELAALWARSWRARGWEPRIYLIGRGKQPRPSSPISHFGQINFSLAAKRGACGPIIKCGDNGWESSPVVDFGVNALPDFVLKCGPTF